MTRCKVCRLRTCLQILTEYTVNWHPTLPTLAAENIRLVSLVLHRNNFLHWPKENCDKFTTGVNHVLESAQWEKRADNLMVRVLTSWQSYSLSIFVKFLFGFHLSWVTQTAQVWLLHVGEEFSYFYVEVFRFFSKSTFAFILKQEIFRSSEYLLEIIQIYEKSPLN